MSDPAPFAMADPGTGGDGPRPVPSGRSRALSAVLYRHPRTRLGLLLAAPLGWLVIAYLGSLGLFLVTSLWSVHPVTGNLVTTPTLDNYLEIATTAVYRTIAVRTLVMAALVTATTVVIAFPIAFYMARLASSRTRGILVVSILLPLWSGYLVKVYAWRLILSQNGVLNGALAPLGLAGPGYSDVAVWLVESYLWLPYMIIPIYAGLERIPSSLLEASSDLGGRAWLTFRRVILPLALPAVLAGSIFTFSLTLGDYITPTLVSNSRFIGNVVYDFVGVAGNQPLAAAFAMVPVTIMLAYLFIASRLGAFEAI
ncbi:MAG: putative spermidine/putrescine transport system permease protein [Chloroflexota bacterium]|jgi:putative spermidine/putrescine transport system permease protein|nr:putative spermidine/putrescine transport system permease protein [Chloroflexota bacterium]